VNAKVKRRNTNRVRVGLWRPAVILVVLAIVAYGVKTIRGMNAYISHPPVTSAIPATVVQINPKKRLGDHVVSGDLNGVGQPLLDRDVEIDGHR